MAKKRVVPGAPDKTGAAKCPVCGSSMNLMSRSPDVWLCPKCGFKLAAER